MPAKPPRCGIRGCPHDAKPGASITVMLRRYSDGSTDERELPICAEHESMLGGITPGSVSLVRL